MWHTLRIINPNERYLLKVFALGVSTPFVHTFQKCMNPDPPLFLELRRVIGKPSACDPKSATVVRKTMQTWKFGNYVHKYYFLRFSGVLFQLRFMSVCVVLQCLQVNAACLSSEKQDHVNQSYGKLQAMQES